MPARLSVYFPDRPVRRLVLGDGEGCLVGRGEGCDLALDDARVSRRHARLAPFDGGWRVEDLGSKNGTLVDGEPPRDGALPEFAWLSFGGLLARFETLSESDRRAAADRERERWQTSVLMQRTIAAAEGLEAVLDRTLTSVLGLCEAERAGIVLVRPDGELEVAAAAGTEGLAGAPASKTTARGADPSVFSGSRGAIERALAGGRPVALTDARADSGLGERVSIVAGGIRALVCLPLTVLGRPIGALYADSRRPGSAFTELDVEILEALAGHAALAIGVARIENEVAAVRGELPTRVDAEGAAAEGADAGAAADHPLAAAWERALPAWKPAAAGAPRAPALGGSGDELVTRAVPGRAADER